MRYSQRWWGTVALLFAFAWTVSVPTAQTEDPSGVNASSSAEVQSDSVGAQSSEQKKPTLTPNRDTAAAANVEMDRRFNELRRELLDDRAKTLDWWLATTAIFLTFLAIIIPLAAFIGGRFSFKKFNEIKEEAQRYVEEIKAHRDEADSLIKEINAEVASADPGEPSEVVKSVQQNPESSPIDRTVSEAILLQQQNRTDEAIEKWRSIANITEGTDKERATQSWFSIGYLLHSKDEPDFDAAINAYDAVLRLNPNHAEAYNNRGLARDALGQHEAAIADYDAALRLNPNAEAYNNRGVERNALGQHEAAIADYDAALRLNPNHAKAYNNRGGARYALGQYEAAIADCDSALRLKPDYAKAYNNRGLARDALGQHEAAIADCDSALRLKPDYTEAYYNRGLARLGLGQHEAAIADCDVTLRLKPNYAKAYYTRGLAELQLNRIDAARQDFERVLNLAQTMGSAEVVERARLRLENLDRGDAP